LSATHWRCWVNKPDPIEATAAEEVVRALLTVAVHPVWREAVEIVAAHDALERRKIEAYEDRTRLLRDEIMPKLVPLAITFLTVLVGWVALQLGVVFPT